jgi:cytochrome P450
MLPAFHGKKMQALEGLMTEVTEQQLASWPRDRPIVLHDRFQDLTLEIILRTVFGLDEGERLDRMRALLTEMLALGTTAGSVVTFLQRDLGPLTPFRRFMQARAEADELIYGLIDERRAETHERDDILSMFLEARHDDGSPMSNQELRDELMTMLVAGHETTASQLAWVFAVLPRQPRVTRRLQEEIDSNDGDEYLTATINEVMRARPVLPNAEPRLTMRPVEIGGWLYPEGVALICNGYLVHHDRDVYEDPYVFRPERFLDEPPGTYTFLPWGGGRRRCIGASFATFEMQIVIKTILGGSDIKLGADGPELPKRRAITISTRRGAPTILTNRVREPALAA